MLTFQSYLCLFLAVGPGNIMSPLRLRPSGKHREEPELCGRLQASREGVVLLVLRAALHLCLQNFPGLSQENMALRLGASCSKPGGLPEMGAVGKGRQETGPRETGS